MIREAYRIGLQLRAEKCMLARFRFFSIGPVVEPIDNGVFLSLMPYPYK